MLIFFWKKKKKNSTYQPQNYAILCDGLLSSTDIDTGLYL